MTIKELIEKHKTSTSQYEKACLESEIWEIIRTDNTFSDVRKKGIGHSLRGILGETLGSIINRHTLFHRGFEVKVLWEKIDHEGMTISSALKILQKAKKNKNISLLESVNNELHSYNSLGILVMRKNGKSFRKKYRVQSEKKMKKVEFEIPENWDLLKKSVADFLKNETSEVNDLSNYEIISNFIIDLEFLIRDCRNKINKLKEQPKAVKKSEIEEACSVLGIDRFKFGDKIDLEIAKSKFKKLVRDSHPDLHGVKFEWKFKEIVSAFRIVEDYVTINSQM
jgi:hypothetical protein